VGSDGAAAGLEAVRGRLPVVLPAVSHPEAGVAACLPAVATVDTTAHVATVTARNGCLASFVASLVRARKERAARQQAWREKEEMAADNWSRSVAKIQAMYGS